MLMLRIRRRERREYVARQNGTATAVLTGANRQDLDSKNPDTEDDA